MCAMVFVIFLDDRCKTGIAKARLTKLGYNWVLWVGWWEVARRHGCVELVIGIGCAWGWGDG